jgi:uncharacterized lipoprotein YbaY
MRSTLSSPRSIVARRTGLLVAVVALLAGLAAIPTTAADQSVTGSLTYVERVSLSPTAVAIVTIVDTTADPDAGAVIGQQRIDAPTSVPIDFSVLVDSGSIDPSHAYALFATIEDGPNVWQNHVGEPVITGGPTKGLELVLPQAPAVPPATIEGAIVPPTDAVVDESAVVIAALIKVETGTLAARQVRTVVDPTDLAFSIGFDPSFIDPTATYVVKGGIVDGATVWQNRDGAPAIEAGSPVGEITLPVTLAPTGVPIVSPAPTQEPPSAQPSEGPTSEPSDTAEPTTTPEPTPSPTATPEPTPSPTATPEPTPSPTPTASESTSPPPITSPVTGSLSFREPYELTRDAIAVVALVRGTKVPTESSIVTSEIDRDITAYPVDFSLAFDPADIDPDRTYTIQATIIDGDEAWVTGQGVKVITKGNPTDVDITLTYRPDLVKGTVTGKITAVGLEPSSEAYSMAVLVDPDSGDSLGIDVRSVEAGLPVSFAIPYTITDIRPNNPYVVTAEVGDQGVVWQNMAGVPVITNGNPRSDVQVVVTEVVPPTPSPTPSPTASPTPVPSATVSPGSGRRTDGGLLGIIILIAVGAALVAFFIARGRGESSATPPTGPDGAGGTTADPGATGGAASGQPPEPPTGSGPAS